VPKKEHYRHTVYIRGEGYELLREIVERVNATKTDVIVLALKLLKEVLELGPGENMVYMMSYDLWSELYDWYNRYHGWKQCR